MGERASSFSGSIVVFLTDSSFSNYCL